jgi:hypothetical protein
MTLPYQGGLVDTFPVQLLPVFYGAWQPSDPALALVTALLSGLASAPIWGVVRKYTSASGAPVTSNITVGQPVLFGAPYGAYWGQTDHVAQIAAAALRSATGATIPVVITSTDVQVPDMGGTLCGYHDWTTARQPYIFVGDSSQTPGCYFRGVTQLMPYASTLVHEVAETLSDPLGGGWVNPANGDEVGDLCAWNLPPLPGAPSGYYTAPSGVAWNLNVSGNLFLTQSLWDPVEHKCSIGDSAPLPPPPRRPPPPANPPPPPGATPLPSPPPRRPAPLSPPWPVAPQWPGAPEAPLARPSPGIRHVLLPSFLLAVLAGTATACVCRSALETELSMEANPLWGGY